MAGPRRPDLRGAARLVTGVAIGIAARAGMKLMDVSAIVKPSALTLWVALGTLVAQEAMYRYTLITANRFNSNMLRASACHHRSDALSSLVVAVGIGGSLMGFAWFGAVAAIVVAGMIIKVGVQLSWTSLRELVDTGLGTKDLDYIRNAILTVSGRSRRCTCCARDAWAGRRWPTCTSSWTIT